MKKLPQKLTSKTLDIITSQKKKKKKNAVVSIIMQQNNEVSLNGTDGKHSPE